MFALGGAGCVEQAGLGYQDERPFGVTALPGSEFGLGYFIQGAAKMNGARAVAAWLLPRDRPIKRVIDFECRDAVTVALKMLTVSGVKASRSQLQQPPGRNITKNHPTSGHLAQGFDAPSGDDFATQRP